ncbi:MAG: Nif3-like dinuclear metal center hexameric protein [Frankiaceae bacterium]
MPFPTSEPAPAGRVATVAEVVAELDRLYDPRWAEGWDAVGLVCGDPGAPVRRVLLAVDPVAEVAEEAIGRGADLLVTHHPLFLRGVHGVPATTAKGRLVHRLIRAGVALHAAHTNADAADPGVSDALARALGLAELRPLEPHPGEPIDKLVTFVPHEAADRVLDALAEAGAGRIGDYSRCAWSVEGEGTFRPEPGARPAIGEVGSVERVGETRLETVLRRDARRAVVAALLAAHPYEEPAYDVIELAAPPSARGIGRVGRLAAPVTAAELARRAAAALPATAGGLRLAGDPDRRVEVVAVCGGAGDGLLGAARRSGADLYLTADLRHHPASEHVEEGGPVLVDAAHWATEWPWLRTAAEQVRRALADRGTTVEVEVSHRCTDPWRLAVGGSEAEPGPRAGEGTGAMRAPMGGRTT